MFEKTAYIDLAVNWEIRSGQREWIISYPRQNVADDLQQFVDRGTRTHFHLVSKTDGWKQRPQKVRNVVPSLLVSMLLNELVQFFSATSTVSFGICDVTRHPILWVISSSNVLRFLTFLPNTEKIFLLITAVSHSKFLFPTHLSSFITGSD